MSGQHGPSGLAGHITMQCLVGLPGCDDLACVCACHSEEEPSNDLPKEEGRCGEPADRRGFFRCGKPAGHAGDRHHADFGVGSYTWGYVRTEAESSGEQP